MDSFLTSFAGVDGIALDDQGGDYAAELCVI